MPIKWTKKWVSDETFESAGVFDVDNDGVLDIVSGEFWYQGPDFKKKHFIGKVQREGEYYDDFSTIPMDVDGDGFTDYVTGGWWGNTLRWRQNPREVGKPWAEHIIAEVGNVETSRAWDMDGDGVLEFVPNCPGNREVAYYKLVTDANGKGTGKFRKVVMYTFPEGKGQGHGMGCGDVAGNGRSDIVLTGGWLEAPADPEKGEWKWHPDFADAPWEWCGSNPMIVADIDGDGQCEVISGKAHGYGLWWAKRAKDGAWAYHPIDLFNAQYHDMQWVDIDGDGQCELVTGKRHRAHCGNDPGEHDDVGIYYFKWTGEGFAKQVIDYGPIGQCGGLGIHFALADLRKTGRLDIIAPGKSGLRIYFNDGP
ncbi:MAG: VCBS repeat-containing protein [Kiritimatiellaeota bacterium]|nr:VCBS repeat-containing protein [Kiritimatiellota bacterium]